MWFRSIIGLFVSLWQTTKWGNLSIDSKIVFGQIFVCHFQLFNGRFAKAPILESGWHADTELTNISAHQPMALKSLLGFFRSSTQLEPSSDRELSKFGLVPIDYMDFSNKTPRRPHHLQPHSWRILYKPRSWFFKLILGLFPNYQGLSFTGISPKFL